MMDAPVKLNKEESVLDTERSENNAVTLDARTLLRRVEFVSGMVQMSTHAAEKEGYQKQSSKGRVLM